MSTNVAPVTDDPRLLNSRCEFFCECAGVIFGRSRKERGVLSAILAFVARKSLYEAVSEVASEEISK